MSRKNLLFINGEEPNELPQLDDFDLVGCTDGAFHYLRAKDNFSLEELDFISGDFDSYDGEFGEKFIHTPDQNKTDFHKALEIIEEKGGGAVWVYGASGKEQDHFLGNLNTAYLFKNRMQIRFVDDYSLYFFAPERLVLENVKGKMISLMPFPLAEGIFTEGLHWELKGESLSLTERVGTRNFADTHQVEIKFEKGALILFISHK